MNHLLILYQRLNCSSGQVIMRTLKSSTRTYTCSTKSSLYNDNPRDIYSSISTNNLSCPQNTFVFVFQDKNLSKRYKERKMNVMCLCVLTKLMKTPFINDHFTIYMLIWLQFLIRVLELLCSTLAIFNKFNYRV